MPQANPFEEIAHEAIRKAEAADVSFPEFVAGLEFIGEAITERMSLAADELEERADEFEMDESAAMPEGG